MSGIVSLMQRFYVSSCLEWSFYNEGIVYHETVMNGNLKINTMYFIRNNNPPNVYIYHDYECTVKIVFSGCLVLSPLSALAAVTV